MQIKIRKNKLLLAFLILFSGHVLSIPQIQLKPTIESVTNLVYFSHSSQLIPLEIKGANECINVTATLWQLSTRLGAELSQQSIMDCKNTKHDFTQSSVPIYFQFTTPTVKHETPFKFEFTSCNKLNSCITIGDFSFIVLPKDLLEPIRIWAKKHTLYVNEKSNFLSSFLDEQLIEYSRSKTLLPNKDTVISLIVITQEDEEINKLLPMNNNQAVILFRQYLSNLPLIFDKTHSTPPLLDVQIPLIEKLKKDAASQKLLLKLFYMLPPSIVTH